MTGPAAAAPAWLPSLPRGVPLSRRLMLLVTAVTLPLVLLGAASLWDQYETERHRAEAQLVAQAQALAQLVDREFERAATVAGALAGSGVLARGDLDAFEAEMRNAASLLSADLPPGTPQVLLRLLRADGERLLDTHWAPGERRGGFAPPHPHIAAALASGRAELSDLFVAQGAAGPLVAVATAVPAPAEDGPAVPFGTLGVGMPRERFASILTAAGLPPGGFASVQDRKGATVIRSYRDAETVGKLPAPGVLDAIMGAPSGMAPRGTRTLEGVPSAIAFARAPVSGYIVKLDVPEEVFLDPLRTFLLRSALTGGIVLGAGLLVAFLLAGRVVAAIRRVPGLALDGAAAGTMAGTTGLREADDLARTLSATLAERRRAEQALRESELRFRTLADAMPQMVWSATPEGRHDYFNARWAAFAGIGSEEAEGQDWQRLIHPEDRLVLAGRWQACLGSGAPFEAECRLRRHDGTYRWVLARALPVRDETGRIQRWFGSFTDIQEIVEAREVLTRSRQDLERLTLERTRDLEATQARLAQAQRMEALGQLAGGIAHDFNNVLQAVQGGAALIGRRPGDEEGVRRLGRMITEAAGRGVTITRRLLAFARRGALHAEPVEAAALLTNMREILDHTLGGGIQVRVQADRALPPLLADKGQLETVLVNLATNARDAMSGHGTLTLSAREDILAGGDAPGHPAGLRPGAYLRISVADTGEGMTAETLARASEPFFTTKSPGQGTGLGLSMAKGFAEQSGGGLALESAPGQGTKVSLWLPVALDTLAPPPPPPPAAEQPGLEGGHRLMLVDDEALIRAVLAEQLEIAGYEVLVAGSAPAALAMLDQDPAVDLIVSDLSMPGMDGLALIREAQRRRPGLPAILLTGFVTDAAEIAMGGAVSGGFSLLSKPVEAGRLVERVAVLLEGARLEG